MSKLPQQNFDFDIQLEEIDRELKMREHVYAKKVEKGEMTEEQKRKKMGIMQDIKRSVYFAKNEVVPDLFNQPDS